jgi:D-alanyl-D-alanine carboxypeptidase
MVLVPEGKLYEHNGDQYMQSLDDRLNSLAQKAANNPRIHDLQLEVETPSARISWRYGADKPRRQFFIASTTKLFTTSLIFQLIDKGAFKLETHAAEILGSDVMSGLHTLQGRDASRQITVRQLLSHTSGIADYFEQKPLQGKTVGAKILANEDVGWSFDDVLEMVRQNFTPRFAPGSGKAFYSDTNYQLLGRIVEVSAGKKFTEALDEGILKPLRLADTYMFSGKTLNRYNTVAPMYHGDLQLQIPRAMASFGADGGMVSTTADCVRFLRAFMNGQIFSAEWISVARDWRRIFFPLQYGLGMMRFQLPRVFTLFRRTPEFIGHSGASGTVLYYAPEKNLYVCAGVNQTRYRDLPYRLLVEIGMAVS